MEVTRTLHWLVPRQSQPGSHRQSSSTSASSLVSTLIPTFLLAVVLVAGFFILRSKQQRVYHPRTFLPVLHEDARTPGAKKGGMFGWVSDFKALPDEYVLNHQSMDQYLYLRFMKMITVMCGVGMLITWPILFPVNATGGGGQKELDVLSFSNVANPVRYFAHTFVAMIYLGYIMWMVTRETIYFINLRQTYLIAPLNASRISSRTVLFTDVPKEDCDEGKIRRTFECVQRVWIPTNCDDLQDLVEDRDDAAFKLEKAEIKLSQDANKKRLKAMKKGTDSQSNAQDGNNSGATKWLDEKKRPTHKLKFLVGKKVDTINWARETLPGMIQKITNEQRKHRDGGYKHVGAVFVEFSTQRAAQTAFQMSSRELPKHFTPRAIGVPPSQIVWKNLKMGKANRKTRMLMATVFISLMILFWTIPVAFVGILSNINYLTNKVPFLSFINKIPSQILGIITGLLPSVLLAVLIALVPIICRLFAKLAGAVTLQEVEMKTQSWYFAFQVIQVFLITTFTSGASAVATQIVQHPSTAPMLLATNLPKASNFYISYFIVYGLAIASKTLFDVVALLMFNIVGRIMDKSPRKMYKRYISLSGTGWGSVYPKWTNLGVIAISYSCIAPLVLLFATISFGLIYLVIRYHSFYTVTTTVDTKGQAYARALQQLTVGVYLAEICLIGLFAISIPTSATSSGPMVLMIIFLVATVIYHVMMHRKLKKLTRTLPESLLLETERTFDVDSYGENGNNAPSSDVSMHPGYGQGDLNARTNNSDKTAVSDGYNGNGAQFEAKIPEGGEQPIKKGSIITRFFNPNKYSSHQKLRDLMRSSGHNHPVGRYPEDISRDAYQNPAINSETPHLWIVRDDMGISRREVEQTSKVLPITDEGAWFDEKGKIVWDHENLIEAPVYDRFAQILM